MAEKKKGWIRRHWKPLAFVGGALALAGTAMIVLGKSESQELTLLTSKITTVLPSIKEIDKVPMRVGEMVDKPWYEGGALNTIVNGVPVSSLGEFGEDMLQLPDVTSDTEVSAVVGFINEAIHEKSG